MRDVCIICYASFTTTEEHRCVAAKCGHIFGNQCLIKWFKGSSKAPCPTCTVMMTKRTLRFIYSSNISVCDNTEMTELESKLSKAQEMNSFYEAELKRNQTTINHLQQELKSISNKKKESLEIADYAYLSSILVKTTIPFKVSFDIINLCCVIVNIEDKRLKIKLVYLRSNKVISYSVNDEKNAPFPTSNFFNRESLICEIDPFLTGKVFLQFYKGFFLISNNNIKKQLNFYEKEIIVCATHNSNKQGEYFYVTNDGTIKYLRIHSKFCNEIDNKIQVRCKKIIFSNNCLFFVSNRDLIKYKVKYSDNVPILYGRDVIETDNELVIIDVLIEDEIIIIYRKSGQINYYLQREKSFLEIDHKIIGNPKSKLVRNTLIFISLKCKLIFYCLIKRIVYKIHIEKVEILDFIVFNNYLIVITADKIKLYQKK